MCVFVALYSSYALLLALALLGKLLYDTFVSYDSSALVITLVAMNTLVILALLLQMVYYGSKANDQFLHHRGILLRSQFAVRELACEMATLSSGAHSLHSDADAKQLLQCDQLLHSVIKCLEVEDQTNPVRILGIRANAAVVQSMITLVLGTISTVVNVVYRARVNANA